jgi:hypothetical protein
MNHTPSFTHLTDSALVVEVRRLAATERQATAGLVASLAEFDRRRLHLAQGYSSLFDYCVKALKLSEHETCNRIEAARAVRKFPELLDGLAAGVLWLTAVRLLAPHLTAANFALVMREAEGRNTEGIKRLIAALHPQPPVPSVVRRVPDLAPAAAAAAAASQVSAWTVLSGSDSETTRGKSSGMSVASTPSSRRAVVAPLSETHYKLQITISAAARERLAQIQDLMRHRVPNGDPAAIVERALDVLHADLLKQKAAEVAKPRAGRDATEAKGRYIPASVKREVWRRDEGRCAFVAPDGRRCESTSGVEFHHVQPYATGGPATTANIEMRCRAHNGFEWERHLDSETAALVAP